MPSDSVSNTYYGQDQEERIEIHRKSVPELTETPGSVAEIHKSYQGNRDPTSNGQLISDSGIKCIYECWRCNPYGQTVSWRNDIGKSIN